MHRRVQSFKKKEKKKKLWITAACLSPGDGAQSCKQPRLVFGFTNNRHQAGSEKQIVADKRRFNSDSLSCNWCLMCDACYTAPAQVKKTAWNNKTY